LAPDLVIANREENRKLDVVRLRDAGLAVADDDPANAGWVRCCRKIGEPPDVPFDWAAVEAYARELAAPDPRWWDRIDAVTAQSGSGSSRGGLTIICLAAGRVDAWYRQNRSVTARRISDDYVVVGVWMLCRGRREVKSMNATYVIWAICGCTSWSGVRYSPEYFFGELPQRTVM
jgi:hypothetical protein